MGIFQVSVKQIKLTPCVTVVSKPIIIMLLPLIGVKIPQSNT